MVGLLPILVTCADSVSESVPGAGRSWDNHTELRHQPVQAYTGSDHQNVSKEATEPLNALLRGMCGHACVWAGGHGPQPDCSRGRGVGPSGQPRHPVHGFASRNEPAGSPCTPNGHRQREPDRCSSAAYATEGHNVVAPLCRHQIVLQAGFPSAIWCCRSASCVWTQSGLVRGNRSPRVRIPGGRQVRLNSSLNCHYGTNPRL